MNREVLKSTENGHHGKWVGGGWGGNLNMDSSQLLLFQKLGCGVKAIFQPRYRVFFYWCPPKNHNYFQ